MMRIDKSKLFQTKTMMRLILVFLFLQCISIPQAQGTFEITRVGVDKKAFTPSDHETVTIRFEVTKSAHIEILLYDTLGRHIKTLSLGKCEAGKQEAIWNGKTEEGDIVCGNVVLYVIKAKTDEGEEFIHNPVKETGGMEMKTLDYSLDTQTGTLEYVLPQTAMIRIRAGLNDGMLFKTILDWQPSMAGRHTLVWDGTDDSGKMNLLKHPDLEVRLLCCSLPTNTIIVKGQTGVYPTIETIATRTVIKQRQAVWGSKGKYLHYTHDPRFCHQPGFRIQFPTAEMTPEGQKIIASGTKIPIRIDLDPYDARALINQRFEIMLFIDGIFIYEMEEGSSPFTFYLDTQGYVAGNHLLTVNIIGYHDHIGILSQPFILGEK